MTDFKTAGVEWCKCPQCQMVFGYIENGGEHLRVGKLRVKMLRAECGGCGYPLWWHAADRHLKNITEKRTTSPPPP